MVVFIASHKIFTGKEHRKITNKLDKLTILKKVI